MKNKIVTSIFVALVFFVFAVANVFALGDFERSYEIPIPEAELNNGGVGNMISGVDVDGDGKTEIYLVNDNWNDKSTEVIPRIYKLEYDGTDWAVVWSATIEPFYQNTWPCLSLADLDKDGKQELVWGPVNSFSVSTNPDRIVVYEHAGDDVFGIDNGDGTYTPNSTWTITDQDNLDIRPVNWKIADIDDDGVDEIIFADRKGNDSGYHIGVISVDNIPDDGDGSEIWTLEFSALDLLDDGMENKWDIGVIGDNFYAFCELEISKFHWNGSDWEYTALSPLPGGISFDAVQVCDLDGDGVEEMITGEYTFGDNTRHIWLLQEEADTLKRTPLFDIAGEGYLNGGRLVGGDMGDINGDGYMDFVFGSRASSPNGVLFHLAYNGGDITDPANYTLSVLDSAYAQGTDEGIWNVINIANVDDDPELEVLYTSSTSYGGDLFNPAHSAPIIVMNYTGGWQGGAEPFVPSNLVVHADFDSIGLRLKPGRILDNGETIWLTSTGSSLFGHVSYAYLSTNAGETFTRSAEISGHRVAQLDAFDENIAVLVTAEGSIWRTDNGGVSWTEVHSYTDGWFDGVRVLNDSVAVAYGDGPYFCRTTDKGVNWTEITDVNYLNAIEGIYTYGMAACNVGEAAWFSMYSSSDNNTTYIFKTTDAGLTWSSVELSPEILGGSRMIYGMSFADLNNGMANANGKKPIYTTDGGATWDSCATNPGVDEDAWVNSVIAVPGENIFIALCDYGLYYTEDMGDTWVKMGTPSNTDDEYYISAVVLNRNYAYFMTQQGTAVIFEGQAPSGIASSDTKILDQYELHQNYPNPFNPTTSISFHIPQKKYVKLVVYDMLGREVISLVDNHLQQGNHSVVWDGKDKHGYNVSTGVYIYQLQVDGITKTRKMTLIK